MRTLGTERRGSGWDVAVACCEISVSGSAILAGLNVDRDRSAEDVGSTIGDRDGQDGATAQANMGSRATSIWSWV